MSEPLLQTARKFLVIVDETEECDRALTFAAYRAQSTHGTVMLMAVIEPDEFEHWLGVKDVMRAEAREAAEEVLAARAARISAISDTIKIETIIREGNKAEEIEKLIAEDKSISILVLAAGTSSEGPGPLVTAFTTRGGTALPIPITIVPGHVSDPDIISVC